MISSPLYSFRTGSAVVAVENLTGHKPDSRYTSCKIAPGHSRYAYAVVIDSSYQSSNMCPVVMCIDEIGVSHKIVTIDIVPGLFRIMPHICRKILMGPIDTTVNHSHYHIIGAFCEFLPCRNHVDITPCNRTGGAAIIVQMPLPQRQFRIIKKGSTVHQDSFGPELHDIHSLYT